MGLVAPWTGAENLAHIEFDLQTVQPLARHHMPPNYFYDLFFVLYFCFIFV